MKAAHCSLLTAILALLAWSTPTPASTQTISIDNSSFENSSASSMPLAWSLQSPRTKDTISRIDRNQYHSGKASLLVHHANPASTTWISQPMQLQIGRLYRLEGWVRTENAFSDKAARYPTPVAACMSMESFPFTNHSQAQGATRDWTRIEAYFIATQKTDRVRLHLGYNATAAGSAWFDDIKLEEVENIDPYIPKETVRWYGPAFRYDDRGWINVHIEGDPYERGYQLGNLLFEEIIAYLMKLAHQENLNDPKAGWEQLRFTTQAFLLNGYAHEYQLEMKGTADGAANAGAKVFDRKPDLLDIAVLNSIIDLGQMKRALLYNHNATSGMNFFKTEDELKVKPEYHKCSAFAATGSATRDGRAILTQMFMWNGYTGVHWNIILDVKPTKGHRFVFQTFPGGIHSGADFYISRSGLVIGETTVLQTPFNPKGSPQSNRIRKAVQYADTIDQWIEMMTNHNNGLYTNEWPFADIKSDEVGIFLLGTFKHRLWRSKRAEFIGGLKNFYWCNNNNKDPEVRKEYLTNPDNAPFDLTFRPYNRDIAFQKYYTQYYGKIDPDNATRLMATPPINLSHACDGKLTTSDMAEHLVFLAHFGKTTLREKIPGSRVLENKPNAEPHLSLGYSFPSPIFIGRALQASRPTPEPHPKNPDLKTASIDIQAAKNVYTIDKRKLWQNTVFQSSGSENWLVSGSATYWQILQAFPEKEDEIVAYLDGQLGTLNNDYLHFTHQEGDLIPTRAATSYHRYIDYQVPRIKGTFLLHQLRMLLGNDKFLHLMDSIYTRFKNRTMTNPEFVKQAGRIAKRDLSGFIHQWIDRKGLPDPKASIICEQDRDKKSWKLTLDLQQPKPHYHLLGTVEITTGRQKTMRFPFEARGASTRLSWSLDEKPEKAVLNPGFDFPTDRERYHSPSHFLDNYHDTRIVYGTNRQIEANHSMAVRLRKTLADNFTEILLPLRKDSEITLDELSRNDLIILGTSTDNRILRDAAEKTDDLTIRRNLFVFRDKVHARPDEGIIVTLPSPYNPSKKMILITANSAMQLYHMTGQWIRDLPGWAIFKKSEPIEKGHHPTTRFVMPALAQSSKIYANISGTTMVASD